MLLDIDPECFQANADLRLILDLIHLVQSERHEWQPTTEAALAADDYFEAKLGKRKQERPEYLLVKKYLEVSSYPCAEGRWAPVQIAAEHLADLVHDLGLPMTVVVENRFNDGECLIFQARLFQRDRIVRAERKGWIEFHHSGGTGQLPDHGQDQGRWFRRLVRVVLVVDGDVRVPGKASAHHARLNRLHGLGVRVFIWPGMELENFLPVRVLVDGRDAQAQQWADSVRALPWEKRAHIDLKNGLPDTANPAPRQRVPTHDELAFYNTIPADHRAVVGSAVLLAIPRLS